MAHAQREAARVPAPRGMEDDDVAADASHSPAAAPSLAPTPPAPLALQFRETIVLPGDDVTEAVLAGAAASGGGGGLKLGAGLVARGDAVVVTKPGVLSFKPPARFYVAAAGRRYIPAVGDNVVGVVIDRNAEFYRVRLHGSCVAVLPALAFDGASKRNKPNLLVGSLVFARVAACSKFLDAELSCQVTSGPKKDWTSGAAVLGALRGGTLVKASLAYARRLLDPSCAVLNALGGRLAFEVAVGANGLVWVNAGSPRDTVAVCSALEKGEALTDDQARLLVDRLLDILLRPVTD